MKKMWKGKFSNSHQQKRPLCVKRNLEKSLFCYFKGILFFTQPALPSLCLHCLIPNYSSVLQETQSDAGLTHPRGKLDLREFMCSYSCKKEMGSTLLAQRSSSQCAAVLWYLVCTPEQALDRESKNDPDQDEPITPNLLEHQVFKQWQQG